MVERWVLHPGGVSSVRIWNLESCIQDYKDVKLRVVGICVFFHMSQRDRESQIAEIENVATTVRGCILREESHNNIPKLLAAGRPEAQSHHCVGFQGHLSSPIHGSPGPLPCNQDSSTLWQMNICDLCFQFLF